MAHLALEETGRPRDTHTHCSICHFRFWQSRKIFSLGCENETYAKFKGRTTDEERYFFLGESYRFTFDRSEWRPVRKENGTLQYERPSYSGDSLYGFFGAHPSKPNLPHRFPVCWDCFRVIREFLSFRNKQPRHAPSIDSLSKLYRVLDARWNLTQWGMSPQGSENPDFYLSWPHDSYRGPFMVYDRFARSRLLSDRANTESVDDWLWLIGDPYRPLPSLPDFLLKHLQQTVETEPHEHDTVPNNVARPKQVGSPPLLRLPQEVLSIITSYLDANSCFSMRLACYRLATAVPLDQRFWYEKFMFHNLFGFFFDFDITKVIDETRRKCKKRGKLPPDWDWKRLVRELALFSSFQNGGIMDDAPDPFRNRRRIWKILEVAEVLHRKELVS